MPTRVVLQDNLWFRGPPRLSNYRLHGVSMIPVEPLLGLTASDDAAAKRQELTWLNRYTGREGSGLVITQEWIQPHDLVDTNLRQTWLPAFEALCPRGHWAIFYDPILAAAQRRLLRLGRAPNFTRRRLLRMWQTDLEYLARYFDHPQYWRLGGRPVLYVWAAFALRQFQRAARLAHERDLYLLGDVLGSNRIPRGLDGLTGFTAALPGFARRDYRLRDLLTTYRRHYVSLQAVPRLGRDRRVAPIHDFIPAGSCQYDDGAFMAARGKGETPLRILAGDRRQVEEFLRLARSFAKPLDGTRYVLWGTLNNWAEGTTVLPTATSGRRFRRDRLGHYRFAHLEALARALF